MVAASGEQTCPFCQETIKAGAVVCRYCASGISPAAVALDHGGVCPFCRETVKPGAVKCRHCQSRLLAGTAGRRPLAADFAGGVSHCKADCFFQFSGHPRLLQACFDGCDFVHHVIEAREH